jgi:hypothetical protein
VKTKKAPPSAGLLSTLAVTSFFSSPSFLLEPFS